jgi:short-subunit dehydrogenase
MHGSALVKGKKLPTSEDVATKGYRALQRGQRVYIPGCMNWLLAQSVRFSPRNLVTALVKQLSKPINT